MSTTTAPVKAYAAAKAKAALAPTTIERRAPRPHDVVIDIKYCGICHSDIHQARDEWGGGLFPMVPGHEIAGVVASVGAKVTKYEVGQRVGVGCFVDSCRKCVRCHEHLEQYCEEGFTGTYSGKDRETGAVTQGGYSTRIVVDENYVLRIPDNLPLEGAAPLLCAGITLYSPLKHWGAGPGKKVAIVGLGGLGHMGVKIAHGLGAEVTVLSQSMRKAEDAKRLGADRFYATSDPKTFETLQDHFDLIINTVSAQIDWNAYLSLLKFQGTMVMVGIPDNPVPVSSFSMIGGRRALAGSLIGGIEETQEMLDFCGSKNIVCDIEMIDASRINEAYDRVVKSDVRYRFVIDVATI